MPFKITEQLQRRIIDTIPVAVITMDYDFKITSFNKRAEEMTNWPACEAIGSACYEVLQSSRCENGCPLQAVEADREPATGLEAEIVNRSGGLIPVSIGVAVIEDDDGGFLGYLEVIEDISRQKETERERSNFISMIAHDMKTPLIAIAGLVKRLQKENTCKGDDKLWEYLRVISSAEERLEALVQEFLEYSRLESGQLKLERKETAISDIIRRIVEMHQPQAEEQKISLSCRYKPVASIKVDSERLLRVFANLVDNAIKFSPEQTEINISVKETDQEVVVLIQDQGWGIKPEELPYIFDAFHRVTVSQKRPKGHGLGLAAVKTIVRQHGGHVTVESTPGKGSIFTVRLPKHPKEEIS